MLSISSLSTVHLRIPVRGELAGAPVDPTGDAVAVALVAGSADPQPADWIAGSWEADARLAPPTYYARVLVGPGGDKALAKGSYNAWVRLSDPPEVPVIPAGQVVVF